MNKKLFLFLIITVLIISIIPLAAYAEDEPVGIYKVTTVTNLISIVPKTSSGSEANLERYIYQNAEQVKISYTGAVTGKYYLIYVLNDNSGVPTKDNIVYINQETATNGTVTFNTVFPSVEELGKTYNVYISSNATTGITTSEKVATFEYKAPYMLGDVNDTNSLSSADALIVLKAAGNSITLTSNQFKKADVNHSNSLSGQDALWILEAISGKRTL